MNRRKYDAILVLGLQLNADDSPREELLLRASAAVRAYFAGLSGRVIASGGATSSGHITEAQVIRDLMTAGGVPYDAIQLEDRSVITVENFRNVRAMLPGARPRVLIVTSDYHMYRSRLICHRCGMRSGAYKARIPHALCAKARRFEPLHTLDYLLGYQDGTRARPAWYTRLMLRLMKDAPPGRVPHQVQ